MKARRKPPLRRLLWASRSAFLVLVARARRLFDLDVIALGITPIVATILPLAVFAGLSYDGPAFAMQLAAGVSGRDDRMGRAAALLLIAGPAVVATCW